MIPTSIDGTDITGATIDGTDVTEITVDGQTVFTGLPTIVDDFESGNLASYTVLRGTANVDTNSPVFNGSFSFKFSNNTNVNSAPGDGLNYYPEAGDRITWYVFSGGNTATSLNLFAVPNLGINIGIFHVEVNSRDNEFNVRGQNISQSVSYASKWYLVEVNTNTNGDYRVQLYDGSSTNDSVLVDVSGTDTNITNERAISIQNRRQTSGTIDFITAEIGSGNP